MNTETREFHLGDVLSVITGRLLSPYGIDGVYKILNWMTGESLFTHQLPRVGGECSGPLLDQHPDLATVEVPEDLEGEQAVLMWLAEQMDRYGATRPVRRLAEDDHTRIDPVTELRMLRPDMPIITVDLPDEDGAE